MNICYIVGAGECNSLDIIPDKGDLTVAADAGYLYFKRSEITPDIVIGDFDSLGEIPMLENVVKLNPIKDITDMNAAVKAGIDRGYTEFHLYGACGGRIDHTLANIQLIASLAKKNIKAYIHSGSTVITAIHNKSLEFDSSYKGYISVLSHSDKCSGVCISGLKYTLDNATLSNDFSLGVSNEFIGTDSKITVKNGTAVIIYSV